MTTVYVWPSTLQLLDRRFLTDCKCIVGVVHVDHVANERLYGKAVDPSDILEGKLPPPPSFKQLIDALNAIEDGKFEQRQSDADSDISSSGMHIGLEHDLVRAASFLLHQLSAQSLPVLESQLVIGLDGLPGKEGLAFLQPPLSH